MMQQFLMAPLFTQVTFGRWKKILKAPRPAAGLLYAQAIWHYARANALARLKEFDQAKSEINHLKRLVHHQQLEGQTIAGINKVTDILSIALLVAKGELALAKGKPHTGIALLEQAKAIEDSLRYIEPDDWHRPVRQVLGYAYLQTRNWKMAAKAYREDLQEFPRNGWSLFGLMQAYQRMGEDELAQATGKKFQAAWKHADVRLARSRI